MKTVILCGGKGVRYNKDRSKPALKPLIKINNISILSRIIKIYSKQGVNEFLLLGGYKFNQLKKFSNTFKKLKVRAINTGLNTDTAGRLLKVKKFIGNETFFFTYGDSYADFDLKKALRLKKKNKKIFIVCTFNYFFPYGVLNQQKKILRSISEKKIKIPINAGFYVLDERVFKYIRSASESFEKHTINKIINSKNLKFVTMTVNNWLPLDNKGDKLNMSNKLK